MSAGQVEWTEAAFEDLSWHDNHVHGMRISAGEHGTGELVLDIDHIVEWLCPPGGDCAFKVAPATLTFHEVSDLRIEVDFAKVSAGIVPPSIEGISREVLVYPGLRSYRWTITLGWPEGELTFCSPRFTQVLRSAPFVSDRQCLEAAERG